MKTLIRRRAASLATLVLLALVGARLVVPSVAEAKCGWLCQQAEAAAAKLREAADRVAAEARAIAEQAAAAARAAVEAARVAAERAAAEARAVADRIAEATRVAAEAARAAAARVAAELVAAAERAAAAARDAAARAKAETEHLASLAKLKADQIAAELARLATAAKLKAIELATAATAKAKELADALAAKAKDAANAVIAKAKELADAAAAKLKAVADAAAAKAKELIDKGKDLLDGLTGDLKDAVLAFKNGYNGAPAGLKGLLKWSLSKIPGYNIVEGALATCSGNMSVACLAPEIAKLLPPDSNLGGFTKSLAGGFQGVVTWAAGKLPADSDLAKLVTAFAQVLPPTSDKGAAIITWAKDRFKEAFDKLVEMVPGLEKIREYIGGIKEACDEKDAVDTDPKEKHPRLKCILKGLLKSLRPSDQTGESIAKFIEWLNGFTSILFVPPFMPGGLLPAVLKSAFFKLLANVARAGFDLQEGMKKTGDDLHTLTTTVKEKAKAAFKIFRCAFLKESASPDDSTADPYADSPPKADLAPSCGFDTFATFRKALEGDAGKAAQVADQVASAAVTILDYLGFDKLPQSLYQNYRATYQKVLKGMVRGAVLSAAIPLGAVYAVVKRAATVTITQLLLGAERLGKKFNKDPADDASASNEGGDQKGPMMAFLAKLKPTGGSVATLIGTLLANSKNERVVKLKEAIQRLGSVAGRLDAQLSKIDEVAASVADDTLSNTGAAEAGLLASQDGPAAAAADPASNPRVVKAVMDFVGEEVWALLHPRLQKLLDKLLRTLDSVLEVPRAALVASVGSIPFAGGIIASALNAGVGFLIGFVKEGISKIVLEVAYDIVIDVMADVGEQVTKSLAAKGATVSNAVGFVQTVLNFIQTVANSSKVEGGPGALRGLACSAVAQVVRGGVDRALKRGISDVDLRAIVSTGLGSAAKDLCTPGPKKVSDIALNALKAVAPAVGKLVARDIQEPSLKAAIEKEVAAQLASLDGAKLLERLSHANDTFSPVIADLLVKNKASYALILLGSFNVANQEKTRNETEASIVALAETIRTQGLVAVLPPANFARALGAIGARAAYRAGIEKLATGAAAAKAYFDVVGSRFGLDALKTALSAAGAAGPAAVARLGACDDRIVALDKASAEALARCVQAAVVGTGTGTVVGTVTGTALAIARAAYDKVIAVLRKDKNAGIGQLRLLLSSMNVSSEPAAQDLLGGVDKAATTFVDDAAACRDVIVALDKDTGQALLRCLGKALKGGAVAVADAAVGALRTLVDDLVKAAQLKAAEAKTKFLALVDMLKAVYKDATTRATVIAQRLAGGVKIAATDAAVCKQGVTGMNQQSADALLGCLDLVTRGAK